MQSENFFEELQKVPQEARSAWRLKMLQKPQVQGDYTKCEDCYPNQAFIQARGVSHHIYYEEPKAQPKGLLFIMHGMDGHAGPSAYFGRQVASNNCMAVVALDFRNFGKTATNQKRGYIEDVNVLVADAEEVLRLLVAKYKCHNIFLAGLSLGGAVAFRMAIRQKFAYKGIVLFAPSIRQHPQAAPFMKKIAKFIGWLAPTLEISNSGGSNSSIKHKACRFAQDPLNYSGKVIPGSVRAVLNFIDECSEMFEQLRTPYLLYMGGVEKVVDPFLAVDLDRQAQCTDKTTVAIKDMWHSIWRSDEMLFIAPNTQEWILRRLSS